jgi:hypothetical protein
VPPAIAFIPQLGRRRRLPLAALATLISAHISTEIRACAFGIRAAIPELRVHNE